MTSEKGETVKQYLRDYPTLPSQRIARMIIEKYPDYGTQESIRSMIRHYRGARGAESRITSFNEEFAYSPDDLPIPYRYDSSPFIIQEKSALVLADLHFPVQDNRAIDTVINWAIKHKEHHPIECVILNGDVIDNYTLSRFIQDPTRKSAKEEIEDVKDFLQVLQDSLGLKVYYKFSNHERRFENYLFIHAPKIADLQGLSLEFQLKLNAFNCEHIKDKRILKFGELNIVHGDEFQTGIVSPVNPARTLYLKCQAPTIGSHSHVTSEHSGRTINRKLITCWSTGCLCDLQPEWNPLNNWNHGFAYIQRDDEVFRVINLRIENGIVY
jgi:hypothetical protein